MLRLEELNAIIEKDDFWNNNNNAQIIMRERSQIEESMNDCLSLERRLEDFITLIFSFSNSNFAISILLNLFPKFDPIAKYTCLA